MKNKIIGGIIGFIIIVAITPLVFGKLMNSKFNDMLAKLQTEGYKVKQIKNNNSYFTTDRVFDVIIPASKLQKFNGLKYVEVQVETIFKNMPVTNVVFKGKIVKVVTDDPELTAELNKLIKDKIKFVVTTPDFKVFRFKVADIDLNQPPFEIAIKGFNGIFEKPFDLSYKIKTFVIKYPQFSITLNNVAEKTSKTDGEIKESMSFDLTGRYGFFVVNLKNYSLQSDVKIAKTTSISLDTKFDSLSLKGMADIKNVNVEFQASGLDSDLLASLKNITDPQQKQQIFEKILSKGFTTKFSVGVKDVVLQQKDLGFLNLDASLKINPSKDIVQKLNNGDLKSIDASLNLKTTPVLAKMIISLDPVDLRQIFNYAKVQNGNVVLNIKVKNGKIYINGQEVQ